MQWYIKEKYQINKPIRKEIERLLKLKKWKREIWRLLWIDHSVICREIARNWTDVWRWKIVYNAEVADNRALERRRKANKKHVKFIKDKNMFNKFKLMFKEKHSCRWVDEIIWHLRSQWEEMVCTSTAYNFIHKYKDEREHRLRYWKHGYKKRTWKKKTAVVWVDLIEKRDESINNRETYWDWEVDMVVGPKLEKWWLITILERKSRYVIIVKVTRATKNIVRFWIVNKLKDFKVNSITCDNWSEFADMKEIWKELWCKVYRCHPYSSREKWWNENNNWIIRRWCPKWLSIQQYSEEYINDVQNKINSKPRKILSYKSATDLLSELLK